MSLWSWFSDFCDNNPMDNSSTNPANGLPMIGGSGGVDVEGNPYGFDFSHDHFASSGFDDSFTSGHSSFDHSDPFGSMGHDDHWTSLGGGGFNDW